MASQVHAPALRAMESLFTSINGTYYDWEGQARWVIVEVDAETMVTLHFPYDGIPSLSTVHIGCCTMAQADSTDVPESALVQGF